MKLLENYKTLINHQDKIKQNSIKIFTNFFKDENWINRNIVYYEIIDNCLLLLKAESDFFRLYFFSSNEDDIQKAISKIDIKSKTVLLEIFLKDSKEKNIIYSKFNFCGKILRLRKTLSENDLGKAEPIFAKSNDAEYIMKMQNRFFDKFIDEHLNIEIISDFITCKNIVVINDDRNIVVINDDRNIVGFAIYEKRGINIHLRYIATEKVAHMKGIGTQLLHSIYSSYPKAKVITVWCREDNKNALSFYKRNGFTPDGLADCFYKNNNSELQK